MKRINNIKIDGSDFFSNSLNIDFSSKLNCIMGGRGTGKLCVVRLV